MRTATNTVLLGMAICDLMTISLPAPIYIFYYTLGNNSFFLLIKLFNKIRDLFKVKLCIIRSETEKRRDSERETLNIY